ncbi:anthranilate phosphoribosyltransferase [Elongatibacter sediminis]|uniref:Anthranilate phosphoribosyltransferase n=1 Tax=Elongatibacter sediminis TaxID=3119006 RepID=A0AAW9RLF2_9GAMM
MEIKQAISHIVDRVDLGADDMQAVMRQIMTGEATPIQIGGFLAGLRTKGETVTEITAAARVMRELAMRIDVPTEHLVDTCGTGGDSSGTFNVSTASAFVVAAGGGRVAKHGNRSMSSKSGSADVLEALGVNVDLPPDRVAECIDAIDVGFLFAPSYHAAAKHAARPRQELGTRTLFNLLGPLTNPAGAPHQLLGVFGRRWVEPLAKVLRDLGSRHVLVVHSEDGLDELSIAAPTSVAELRDGQVRTYRVRPEEVGVEAGSLDDLRVDGPEESAARIRAVLEGESGPAADIVALNAGAALFAADVTPSLAEGVARAREVLADGSALERLESLRTMTRAVAS